MIEGIKSALQGHLEFEVVMLFDGAVLQKDCIFEGRINIKSKTGELKGWMKKDLLLPNWINIYDKYTCLLVLPQHFSFSVPYQL